MYDEVVRFLCDDFPLPAVDPLDLEHEVPGAKKNREPDSAHNPQRQALSELPGTW